MASARRATAETPQPEGIRLEALRYLFDLVGRSGGRNVPGEVMILVAEHFRIFRFERPETTWN